MSQSRRICTTLLSTRSFSPFIQLSHLISGLDKAGRTYQLPEDRHKLPRRSVMIASASASAILARVRSVRRESIKAIDHSKYAGANRNFCSH